ncbi:MAG: hypothetical protein V9F06_15615 [Thermomicrobiales bacterium]
MSAGIFWAGSDDGRLHISRDGGESWDEVSIPTSQLPDRPMISVMEPSPHEPIDGLCRRDTIQAR